VMARAASLALVTALLLPAKAMASDPVLDWIKIMNDTVLASGTSPLVTSRNTALVGAAMFDAVNGIEQRYSPLIVQKYTGTHASAGAAAIEAAYTTLVALYPARKTDLDTRLAASLAGLSSGPDNPKEIAAGAQYGQQVANAILAARSHDGFNPPPPSFRGFEADGVWRPTTAGPSGLGAGPQFATMTPWVLIRASQFRVAPANALTSAQYAADYDETRRDGSSTGTDTGKQNVATFWNGNTALYWNRIALEVLSGRNLSLVETAHVFGLLNVSMADAAVACWDSKYRYQLWRPVTAVNLSVPAGSIYGAPDPSWKQFLPSTPAHPEYPSGHSTLSGAAAQVLGVIFGDETTFSIDSETMPGTVKHFSAFSDALHEIHNARVWGGIHWRTACLEGSKLGEDVAKWVMVNAMTDHGDH
jgi:PAP2 superfamily